MCSLSVGVTLTLLWHREGSQHRCKDTGPGYQLISLQPKGIGASVNWGIPNRKATFRKSGVPVSPLSYYPTPEEIHDMTVLAFLRCRALVLRCALHVAMA